MEPEWRIYLQEHAPELYKQMLDDITWAAQWRDERIKELEDEKIRICSFITLFIENWKKL